MSKFQKGQSGNPCAEGKTLAGMADELDVDRETINNWRDAHPEFSRAVKRALEKAQA
jgi:hypothetical protein